MTDKLTCGICGGDASALLRCEKCGADLLLPELARGFELGIHKVVRREVDEREALARAKAGRGG